MTAHWRNVIIASGFVLAAAGMLSSCASKPDLLSEKEKTYYCTQLVDFVQSNRDFTDQLEENIAEEFKMKSTFASRAYWIYGYINESGELSVKPQFMSAEPFMMGYAKTARIGQPPGFIDKSGQTVINGFANARHFTYGLAAVQMIRNGPWGFLEPSGKMVIAPQYTTAHEFTDSRARVEKDGKWGFIDVRGKVAVPLVYDRAEDFHDGEAIVKRGRLWWKVDRFGKQTERKSRKKPKEPPREEDVSKNYKGLVPFNGKGGKVGYKTQSGEEVVKPQFDSGDYFSNGLARVGYICTPPDPEKERKRKKK